MTRSGTRRHAAGFTLLELLVAVAIFGLASALAYGGLSGLVRAREQLQQQSERLQALQFAVGLIERDLRAAVDRPVRDRDGVHVPAMLADNAVIELSRIGRANTLAVSRAEIERVGYRLDGGMLQRLRYDVLDRAPGSVPQLQPLLDDVQWLRWRLIDGAGRVHEQWPPPRDDAAAPLPRAVELRLGLVDGGEIRRLLELPLTPPLPAPAP